MVDNPERREPRIIWLADLNERFAAAKKWRIDHPRVELVPQATHTEIQRDQ